MSRAIRTYYWTALLAACALLGGCNAPESKAIADLGIGSGGCQSDLECGIGLVCIRNPGTAGGMCRLGDCNRERQCTDGRTCDPTTPTCLGATVLSRDRVPEGLRHPRQVGCDPDDQRRRTHDNVLMDFVSTESVDRHFVPATFTVRQSLL